MYCKILRLYQSWLDLSVPKILYLCVSKQAWWKRTEVKAVWTQKFGRTERTVRLRSRAFHFCNAGALFTSNPIEALFSPFFFLTLTPAFVGKSLIVKFLYSNSLSCFFFFHVRLKHKKFYFIFCPFLTKLV